MPSGSPRRTAGWEGVFVGPREASGTAGPGRSPRCALSTAPEMARPSWEVVSAALGGAPALGCLVRAHGSLLCPASTASSCLLRSRDHSRVPGGGRDCSLSPRDSPPPDRLGLGRLGGWEVEVWGAGLPPQSLPPQSLPLPWKRQGFARVALSGLHVGGPTPDTPSHQGQATVSGLLGLTVRTSKHSYLCRFPRPQEEAAAHFTEGHTEVGACRLAGCKAMWPAAIVSLLSQDLLPLSGREGSQRPVHSVPLPRHLEVPVLWVKHTGLTWGSW